MTLMRRFMLMRDDCRSNEDGYPGLVHANFIDDSKIPLLTPLSTGEVAMDMQGIKRL